jgi:hypothetical protein
MHFAAGDFCNKKRERKMELNENLELSLGEKLGGVAFGLFLFLLCLPDIYCNKGG